MTQDRPAGLRGVHGATPLRQVIRDRCGDGARGLRGVHAVAPLMRQVKGLPSVRLLLQAAGPVEQVAPEFCGPARRWRSLTPYLPVRHWHPRRETLAEYLNADVAAEFRYRECYRDVAAPDVRCVDPGGGLPDRWARGYRRYRLNEHLGQARPGLGLRLEFAEEVRGPLLLGQLSHFGYGIFRPE